MFIWHTCISRWGCSWLEVTVSRVSRPPQAVTWLPQGLIGSVFQSIWNTPAVHYCARHTGCKYCLKSLLASLFILAAQSMPLSGWQILSIILLATQLKNLRGILHSFLSFTLTSLIFFVRVPPWNLHLLLLTSYLLLWPSSRLPQDSIVPSLISMPFHPF